MKKVDKLNEALFKIAKRYGSYRQWVPPNFDNKKSKYTNCTECYQYCEKTNAKRIGSRMLCIPCLEKEGKK